MSRWKEHWTWNEKTNVLPAALALTNVLLDISVNFFNGPLLSYVKCLPLRVL